jgi:CHAD domain-containing protein
MSDKPALRPEMAVGEALRNVARAVLTDARTAIEDPERSDAEAVHQFRREMKRWRAILRLLDPFIAEDGERLRIEARDIARALGGARDGQSALDALADVEGHGVSLSKRSLTTVHGRVDALRQTAETTTLTGDMRLSIAQVLDRAGSAVERWPLHTLRFPDVAKQLALGYRAARRAIPESWSDADGETLHELRKRVVTHRYQMETVVPLWKRFGKMWTGEAQRLRERLGQHQDLLLLEKLTEPHQPLAPWRSKLAPAIAERKADHVRAARRMATRLLIEQPKAFRRKLEAMWESGG